MALPHSLQFCYRFSLRYHQYLLVFVILICFIPAFLLHSSARLQTIFREEAKQSQPAVEHRYRTAVELVRKIGQRPFDDPNNLAQGRITYSHKILHGDSFDKLYAKDRNAYRYPPFLRQLASSVVTKCGGKFQGVSHLFAIIHDVVIDTAHCTGPKGGEDFHNLMNQRENIEYLTYTEGFFSMDCKETIGYRFRGNNHLNRWMDVLHLGVDGAVDEEVDDFTIAITRYEYVNMYHTMTDFYNAFLVMAFWNRTQHQTNIIILDGHPAGGLDSVWGTIFNSMTRVSQLKPKTRFANLAFGILGYKSPLFVSENVAPYLPLANEFREFFLSSYNLPLFYPLKCDKLSILLIWRRNYVAHPRNPTGSVHRKFMNEIELVEGIQKAYPTAKVRGVQMDRFDMGDQVKMFAECDILVGVHGAAMTEMLFMHERRGIIEVFPSYVNPLWRSHFVKMARVKNMIYKRWVNKDAKLEHSDYRTEVPPYEIVQRIREIRAEMCPQS